MSEQVCVVSAPIGPPCCVQTADGRLIRGYRVPPDHRGDVVHVGRCVRWRHLDAQGNVVFDGDGVQQWAASANGMSLLRLESEGTVQVRAARPPPLRPPTVRRGGL